MAKRSERHQMIRRIIREKPIRIQGELVRELKKAGHKVTQATVSRDVNDLGLEKISVEGGKSVYALPEDRYLKRMCEDLVQKIEQSSNLLVIKTSPGTAQGVASALDGAAWEEVLGTIAGDDTILVVTTGDQAGSAALQRLKKLKT